VWFKAALNAVLTRLPNIKAATSEIFVDACICSKFLVNNNFRFQLDGVNMSAATFLLGTTATAGFGFSHD
jgi:hypothetical protein